MVWKHTSTMNEINFVNCSEELAFILDELIKDSSAASTIQLVEWKSKLREQGLDCNSVVEFFCGKSLLEHWRSSKSIKENFTDAISANISTTDFIESIRIEESDYSEQVLAAVDSLMEERNALMATAGGHMNHPIGGWIGIGLSAGVVLALVLTRKTWVPFVSKKIFNKEVSQIEQEASQKLDQDIISRSDILINNPANIVNNDDKFVAHELINIAHNSDSNISGSITNIHRKVERDDLKIEENPEAFLDEAIKLDKGNFQLNLIGFQQYLSERGQEKIREAADNANKAIDKMVDENLYDYIERYDDGDKSLQDKWAMAYEKRYNNNPLEKDKFETKWKFILYYHFNLFNTIL